MKPRCFSRVMLERMLFESGDFSIGPHSATIDHETLGKSCLNLNFLICKVRIFGSFQLRNSVTVPHPLDILYLKIVIKSYLSFIFSR